MFWGPIAVLIAISGGVAGVAWYLDIDIYTIAVLTADAITAFLG
jgi:hypothetical protein